jgi:hypothetical protein
MVIIHTIPAITLASGMFPTLANSMQQPTCLLAYHANHGTPPATVFSLEHGSDFGHRSAPSVGPTSQLS